MDADKIDEIKAKFIEEIKKTEDAIISYKEITKPIAPDCAIGRVSRMDAINNKSVAEAALRQAEQKLVKLKYAFSKVDDEGFGLCAKCGKTIPLGRILLMPQSRHCVNCAS